MSETPEQIEAREMRERISQHTHAHLVEMFARAVFNNEELYRKLAKIEAKLAAVTAELDKANAARKGNVDTMATQQREIARLKEEVNRWKTERDETLHSSETWEILHAKTHEGCAIERANLAKFGNHKLICPAWSNINEPCTCGFTDAVASIPLDKSNQT